MNLQRFNFNFNTIYKELGGKVLKVKDTNTGLYHYLERTDRFHDVIEKTIKYFSNRESIDDNEFKSIFWTAWRFNKLQNYDKNNNKVKELTNTTYVDGFDVGYEGDVYGVNYQPDLDSVLLIRKLKSNDTVNKILEGYSMVECAKEVGITREGYHKRFKKELKRLV